MELFHAFLIEAPKYWKFFISLFGGAIIMAQSAVTDGTITGPEWQNIIVALLTSFAVYAKGNKSSVTPTAVVPSEDTSNNE